jgi:hypothetical protein
MTIPTYVKFFYPLGEVTFTQRVKKLNISRAITKRIKKFASSNIEIYVKLYSCSLLRKAFRLIPNVSAAFVRF